MSFYKTRKIYESHSEGINSAPTLTESWRNLEAGCFGFKEQKMSISKDVNLYERGLFLFLKRH